MKILFFLLFIVTIICAYDLPQQLYRRKLTDQYELNVNLTILPFVTKLDHFRPQDSRTVTFNYYANDFYYELFGPIFIFINDFGEFTTKWIENGLMVDIAKHLHASLITYNHRYFGDNLPTETSSYQELSYATTGQSVNDIAYLIETIKQNKNQLGAKVILFGSRYGAKIASYARLRFPHLVDGVWASSGIYEPEAIPTTFYNLLSWNLHQYGSETCGKLVKNAFDTIKLAIENNEETFLQKEFNLCSPINKNSTNDIAVFFENQIAFISDYVDKYHIQGIKNFCRDISAIFDDPMRSFSRWVNFFYNANGNCFDFSYENNVKQLQNESWHQLGTESGRRQMLYMQCTELGYLKRTSENGLFPNVLNQEYLYGLCSDVFGDEYRVTKLVEATNALKIQYGAKDQRATQILYTNGMLDSWIDHAITDDLQMGSKVINMIYSAKSADLESLTGWESIELNLAKNEVKRLIEEWSYPEPK